MFDVAGLDCILKKKEKPSILGTCPNSLGLLILSSSISQRGRENGRRWNEVPECFAEGA